VKYDARRTNARPEWNYKPGKSNQLCYRFPQKDAYQDSNLRPMTQLMKITTLPQTRSAFQAKNYGEF